MKIKAILFDLDGTLLPMDLRTFQQTSSALFAEKMKEYGYEPEALNKASWKAISAMSQNDGSKLNGDVYYEKMVEIYGDDMKRDFHLFEEFYRDECNEVKKVCGYNPQAWVTVKYLKEKGYRLILATNAWFPTCAIENRLRWAGIEPDAFEFYTVMDNSSFCKPNLNYYREILEKVKLQPEECLMVGNDVNEDMCASQIGMNVFLMTDCLINKYEKDIEAYPKGGFDDLIDYIENL